jgi:hypothetical protein
LNGELTIARTFSVGMSEGKRPVGQPRRRWDDNIKMKLAEAGWECVAWLCVVAGTDR